MGNIPYNLADIQKKPVILQQDVQHDFGIKANGNER